MNIDILLTLTRETLVKMIDHTQLSAKAGEKDIANLCQEARHFGFHSVCVNGTHTRFAAEKLKNSNVLICTVVGFPLGANSTASKVFEAREAVQNGAAEIDMVLNIGALHDNKIDLVSADIYAVVDASQPAVTKVILETCYLNNEEIVKACEIAIAAGAKFVKTSTGFGTFGARPDHVRLMRQTVGPDIGVKAAGGIKHLKDALHMIGAGASRLGLSASVAIVQELTLDNLEKHCEQK
jgi:deoxyribose-phosphate aldolase